MRDPSRAICTCRNILDGLISNVAVIGIEVEKTSDLTLCFWWYVRIRSSLRVSSFLPVTIILQSCRPLFPFSLTFTFLLSFSSLTVLPLTFFSLTFLLIPTFPLLHYKLQCPRYSEAAPELQCLIRFSFSFSFPVEIGFFSYSR